MGVSVRCCVAVLFVFFLGSLVAMQQIENLLGCIVFFIFDTFFFVILFINLILFSHYRVEHLKWLHGN